MERNGKCATALKQIKVIHRTHFVGPCRFRSRETFANVPLKGNFEEANTLLASIWSMINLEGASLTEADATLFLSILRERVVKLDRTRTRSALMPVRNSKDLEHVIGRNGTALATVEARSPQWFEDYGTFQK